MLGYYIGDQLGKIWGYTPDRIRTVSDFQIDGIIDPDLDFDDMIRGPLDKRQHRLAQDRIRDAYGESLAAASSKGEL